MRSHGQGLIRQFNQIVSDRLGMIGVIILGLFIFTAIFAPMIAPYSGVGATYHSDGRLAKLEPPSRHHWFGTTNLAEDVFSQTLVGSRLAILVGLISAICVTLIGTNIGLIAGYFGRWTDEILMRITDIAYGIPFLPFGIVLVALLGASKWNIIIAISILMWRTSARVVRAQVLSLRERPFIWSAKTAGASDLRILYVHIAPNILPLSFLYVALGLGWAVTAEASLSFIGLGDPAAVSWGRMLYFAFWAGAIRTAWWWVIPPGVSIGLFVLSCYLIARAYERILNPKLREI
jgi:peptide/nickel transport system permease protein